MLASNERIHLMSAGLLWAETTNDNAPQWFTRSYCTRITFNIQIKRCNKYGKSAFTTQHN